MHGLQDGGDATDVGVDLGVGEELRGEVGVQLGLDTGRGVEPEAGVEKTVVQELLQEQVGVVGRARYQKLGQLKEEQKNILLK